MPALGVDRHHTGGRRRVGDAVLLFAEPEPRDGETRVELRTERVDIVPGASDTVERRLHRTEQLERRPRLARPEQFVGEPAGERPLLAATGRRREPANERHPPLVEVRVVVGRGLGVEKNVAAPGKQDPRNAPAKSGRGSVARHLVAQNESGAE